MVHRKSHQQRHTTHHAVIRHCEQEELFSSFMITCAFRRLTCQNFSSPIQLNLKFMQRKPNPNIKPKLEETPSTKDAQVFRTQGTVTITQSSSTSTSQRRDPPTLRIVFEESLISFPWLSWRRPAPSSSDPAKDGILPAHIGRKSYGEFNKAIQVVSPSLSLSLLQGTQVMKN
ncbi:uncharacterized protein VP01_776g3 [Puccinia sorghi]|uniref:Uncharacterized protein n=1 Tax=Puccinia sorghi TaxID=27349 RepID=A0A0L6UBE9_9BASI|nr:uncharacterized protein VP01_776g3 [Puccinia sorghi]